MTTDLPSPPVIEHPARDEDIAAIRRIIADSETAYNSNNAELLTGHFAENATVVNALGRTLLGRDAIVENTRSGLAGFLRDQFVRYDLLTYCS